MRNLKYNYVGGGWDLYVVYDASVSPGYASAHVQDNWVAAFRDDMEGRKAAEAFIRDDPESFKETLFD